MIYFVRHGQTNDNVEYRIQGNKPLNENGLNQAKDLAEQLKDIHFDICFCSPLIRTVQTLQEILYYHKDLKVVYDDRIKERDYGELVGLLAKNIDGYFNRWKSDAYWPYKTETVDEMYNRVASFYNDLKNNYKDKNILIVSHCGVGRMTYAYFYGKPQDNDYSKYEMKNCEIMKLEI